MPKNAINGEVRISLQTYHDLITSQEKAEQAIENNKEAVRMMGDFLQFLKTKDYFADIQSEFNASHDRLSIKINPDTKRVIIYIDGQKIHD